MQSASAAGADSFVTAKGTQFQLDGKEFKFVGFNMLDTMATVEYKCSWWDKYSDAELDANFKYMHDNAGATVLRVWAYQTYTKGGTDFSGMDKVIALAKKNGMKILPVLEDGPGYCTTTNPGNAKWKNGDSWYKDGYKQPFGTAKLSYRDYVPKVVAHYKDEPGIFGWMLINEADTSAKNAAGQSVLVDFATDMGNVVKNIDKKHLLTVGTQSNGASGASGIDFKAVYSVPTIDFTEAHDWSVYGWGDQNSPLPGSPDNGKSLPATSSADCQKQYQASIACSLAFSKEINKPFVIGESGIAATDDASRASRAVRMDARMKAAFDNGAAGYLMWQFNKVLDTEKFDILPTTNDPIFPVMKKYGGSFLQLGTGGSSAPVITKPTTTSTTVAPKPTPSTKAPAQRPTTTTTTKAPAPRPTPSAPPATRPAPVDGSSIDDTMTGDAEGKTYFDNGWKAMSRAGAANGTEHVASGGGSSATFRFNGTGASVVAATGPGYGKVALRIDGGNEMIVDLYSASQQNQVVIYSTGQLKPGSHRLMIRVLGEKNASASETKVAIDRFIVR